MVSRVEPLDKQGKGDVFERLVQLYLQIDPQYRTTLLRVWFYNDVPQKVRKYLQLPPREKGVDLIAEAKDGSYWAIQAKYRSITEQVLPFKALSTFPTFAFITCRNIDYGLICTTTNRVAKELGNRPETIGHCTSEVWEGLDEEFFADVRAKLANRVPKVIPFRPRPHQRRAIKRAADHYKKARNSRGKMIHPCGAGKTLTAFWIARELKARTILVAVPSLALIQQTLTVWLRESVATGVKVDWLCVCSDETAGQIRQDELTTHAHELGVPCETRPAQISTWLREHDRGTRIIFATYQSGKAIATAARRAGITFDLGIMDEAHKTVGAKTKAFAHLLDDKNVSIRRRVFMTATERRYQGSSDRILSMDDPEVYGETFDLVTFKEAIQAKPPILCDYEVRVITVGRRKIAELIEEGVFVDPDRGEWRDIDAATLASVVALRTAMQKHPIKHAISFHSSIKRAREFQDHNESFSEAMPNYRALATYHVSSNLRTSERAREIDDFVESKRGLITNARCLGEGVNLPAVDGITFADPKRSTVDIVQATGRALRLAAGKKKGYVVVPHLVDDEETDQDQILDGTAFKEVLTVLEAMASNDERIVEQFRSIANGKRPRKRIVRFDESLGEVLSTKIDLSEFAKELELRCWTRLARLGWQNFHDARGFSRHLGLGSYKEWLQWTRGKLPGKPKRPLDIPITPSVVYVDRGWKGWGDWLGTKNIYKGEWQDFSDARQFSRKLGLGTVKEWMQWTRGELPGKPKRPADIPTNPNIIYTDQGWEGWGDWLGTGRVQHKWRAFKKARRFSRSLGLVRTVEWWKWTKGELPGKPKRPLDIPIAPHAVYADQGWEGWGDWLGTGRVKKGKFRAFKKARQFSRGLGLGSAMQWRQWTRGELPGKPNRPGDIPKVPHAAYADQGWEGWGDWLGTGNIHRGNWREFKKSRHYVRSQGLRNQKEWQRWSKGEFREMGKRPPDIPSDPSKIYSNEGWEGWGDWLGTEAK